MSSPTPEEWRTVPGHPDYEVSNRGNVRSLKYGAPRLLSPGVNRQRGNYLTVGLWTDRKRYGLRVNRLVLQVFDREPVEGEEAAHLNGNPQDNRIENLAWQTGSENCQAKREHGTLVIGEAVKTSVFTEDIVREMRALYEGGMIKAHIAKKYNVHPTQVHRVVTRKTWAHVE